MDSMQTMPLSKQTDSINFIDFFHGKKGVGLVAIKALYLFWSENFFIVCE